MGRRGEVALLSALLDAGRTGLAFRAYDEARGAGDAAALGIPLLKRLIHACYPPASSSHDAEESAMWMSRALDVYRDGQRVLRAQQESREARGGGLPYGGARLFEGQDGEASPAGRDEAASEDAEGVHGHRERRQWPAAAGCDGGAAGRGGAARGGLGAPDGSLAQQAADLERAAARLKRELSERLDARGEGGRGGGASSTGGAVRRRQRPPRAGGASTWPGSWMSGTSTARVRARRAAVRVRPCEEAAAGTRVGRRRAGGCSSRSKAV